MCKNINTRSVNNSIRNNSEISRRKDGLNRVNTLAGILRGRQSSRKAQRLLRAPQGPHHPLPPPRRAGGNNVKPSITSEHGCTCWRQASKVATCPAFLWTVPTQSPSLCSRFKLAFNLEAWILQDFSSSKRALLLIWRSHVPSSNLEIWTMDQLTKFWVSSKQPWFFSLFASLLAPKNLFSADQLEGSPGNALQVTPLRWFLMALHRNIF